MKLITPKLEVDQANAFANDVLNRKPYAEALLNLILSSEDELVISLDGDWGSGKTTFIKMWQVLLSEVNVPNIYIDSFSNDYSSDAFLSIAGAISNFAENNLSEDNLDQYEALKKKSIKIGTQILSWSAKVGIKAATLGIIKDTDLEELKDIKNDIAKGFSDSIGGLIEEKLLSYQKDIELVQSFRDMLSEIPSKFTDSDNKPLVVIIDELDRCKPTYAVEVIERIKHLFSVKNVVFVLVMHKAQLQEAIRSVYGQNINAHLYLQKFINVETVIPKRIHDPYRNDLKDYTNKLFELHNIQSGDGINTLRDCIASLAKHFNFSLRQLEKTFTNIAIIFGAQKSLSVPAIISFVSVIKVVEPSICNNLSHKNLSFRELTEQIKMSEQVLSDDRSLKWIMDWIKFDLLSEDEYKQLDKDDNILRFGESLWNYGLERGGLIFHYINLLNMFTVN